MSIPGEASKAVGSITDALKTQPLALALILMNVIFVGMFGWVAHTLNDRYERDRAERKEVIDLIKGKCGLVSIDRYLKPLAFKP